MRETFRSHDDLMAFCVDEAKKEHINASLFEERFSVIPGSFYKIPDTYDNNLVGEYVYLGHGWSMCHTGTPGMLEVMPSHHPHWYTKDPAEINTEYISQAISYIALMYEESIGYEMDCG